MKLRILLVLLAVALSTPALVAQADKPAAASKAPALDESDALAIQVAQVTALRANDACATLQTTKDARSIEQQVLARFDKKYPGYTVDLAKGVLVPKGGK